MLGAYAISKAADMQLVRNLAVEFGSSNIRANGIAPGLIRTDFARALWENRELYAKRTADTPLRRIGEPDEVAAVSLQMREITTGLNPDFAIPQLGFEGTATGIDILKIINTGIVPFIDTATAHREPGHRILGCGHRIHDAATAWRSVGKYGSEEAATSTKS